MPSYTTSLRLIQPATGEYSGSWGTQVNNSLTAVVDKAVAGTATITMAAADYTLTNANGVADEAKSMFLVLQGTPGASYFVIVPTASKLYFVTNNTGFAQSVSTSASGGVSVPNGASMVLRCDGTNVVEALNSLDSIVLNGGTANGVVYLNGSKVVTTGSALVFDGTNLGLGVTPSAWGNLNKALQLSGTGAVSSTVAGNTASRLSHGAYFDNTNWRYTDTSIGAARYEMTGANVGSTHAWYVSAGGTAGNTISFTQAMTLDASGNLLVGQTSGSDAIEATRSGSTSCGIVLNQTGTSGRKYVIASTGSGYGAGNLIFYDYTASSERARITSGGDLLVGTTTSAAKLTVESSGLVAKFKRTAAGGIAQFQNGDDAGYGIDLLNVAGTSAGSIYWTATTTTYATSSDRRLKENVVAAPSASAAIDAIQIVSYDWKSAPNEPRTTYGVIAQDLHTVAPEAVSVGDDGDTVEKPWGVDYSKLVPMLIKEIQSLRARVAALEQA